MPFQDDFLGNEIFQATTKYSKNDKTYEKKMTRISEKQMSKRNLKTCRMKLRKSGQQIFILLSML